MKAPLKQILLAFAASASLLSAADTGMLNMVMPDAKVVSGVYVDQTKVSPLGQFFLSQIQGQSQDFQNFSLLTGFDPRRDLHEVIVAGAVAPKSTHSGLVLARGVFDPTKLIAAAQLSGKKVTYFQNVPIIVDQHDSGQVAAFVDNTLAVLGDLALVKAAIQRGQSTPSLDAVTIATIQSVSSKNDAWFLSLVPGEQFAKAGAGVMNGSNFATVPPNVLQGIQSVSGGVQLGTNIQFSAEAVTRSPQDATALVDVIRFLASMVQGQKDIPAPFSALLGSLNLNASSNVMTVSAQIPESQLETLVPASGHVHAKRINHPTR